MKKLIVNILIIVPSFCMGQSALPPQRIEEVVKSFCNQSHSDTKDWITRNIEVSRIVQLRNYSKDILSCYNPRHFDSNDYYIMSFFDSVPRAVVDTALKYKKRYHNVAWIFEAKYGNNPSVEEELLNTVEKYLFEGGGDEIADRDWKSREYISYLVLLNSDRAKNLLYRVMESTKYTKRNQYDGRQDYKVSLAYVAIRDFIWTHPSAKAVSGIDPEEFEVRDGHPVESPKDIDQTKLLRYKKDVEKFLLRTTKKRIKINTPFFHLGEYRVEKYYSYPEE